MKLTVFRTLVRRLRKLKICTRRSLFIESEALYRTASRNLSVLNFAFVKKVQSKKKKYLLKLRNLTNMSSEKVVKKERGDESCDIVDSPTKSVDKIIRVDVKDNIEDDEVRRTNLSQN